jgi:hypothetical protein
MMTMSNCDVVALIQFMIGSAASVELSPSFSEGGRRLLKAALPEYIESFGRIRKGILQCDYNSRLEIGQGVSRADCIKDI